MEKEAKITFVMPAYNVEKYISVAVNSIKSQVVENWELVIVDDCSTDQTLSIAKELAKGDDRIRVISMPKQSGGCYLPLKKGVLTATTEFVSPLDADDFIEPDYLLNLLNVVEETKADTVFPCMYNWDGERIELKSQVSNEIFNRAVEGRNAVRYALDGWRIHCNGGLIRRSVYLKSFDMIDEENEVLKSYIDEYLTRLILFNSSKVCVTGEKYYYRVHPASVTRAKDFRAFGFLGNNLRLLNMIEKYYPENSEEYKLVQRQNFHCIFDTWRLMRNVSLSPEEKDEVNKVLSNCMDKLDFNMLRGNVSKNYFRLMRLPVPIAKTLLALMDKVKA